jgi:hypothetical protein
MSSLLVLKDVTTVEAARSFRIEVESESQSSLPLFLQCLGFFSWSFPSASRSASSPFQKEVVIGNSIRSQPIASDQPVGDESESPKSAMPLFSFPKAFS